MGIFHVFKIVRMVPNRAKHHIFDVYGGPGHANEANPLCLVSSSPTLHSL